MGRRAIEEILFARVGLQLSFPLDIILLSNLSDFSVALQLNPLINIAAPFAFIFFLKVSLANRPAIPFLCDGY